MFVDINIHRICLKCKYYLYEMFAFTSFASWHHIGEHGFRLNKDAFANALALCYGWAASKTPTKCVCGASFTVDHLLSCARGDFPSLCHNEIRDLTATLLTEVCSDIQVEPDLQEIFTETMTRSTANTAGCT